MSASQLISNMICMNYDHNKKSGLLKFHSGYGKNNLNSPKGYSLKIINAQTGAVISGVYCISSNHAVCVSCVAAEFWDYRCENERCRDSNIHEKENQLQVCNYFECCQEQFL